MQTLRQAARTLTSQPGTAAAGGLYGVLSYAVARRTQELGIRLVMGAVIGLWLGGGLPAAAQEPDFWLESEGPTGLALAAFVTPFHGQGDEASVLVGIEASTRRGTPFTAESVAVTLSIVDVVGSRPPIERIVHVPVGHADTGLVPRPFLTEVALAPGRYELRLRAGAGVPPAAPFAIAFDVASPARPPETPFRIGPLMLTSSVVGTPPAGDASEERRLFPLLLRPPSPRRRFASDERVEAFTEIYDWDSEPGFEQQFTIRTILRDQHGATVHMTEEMGIVERLDSGRFGYAHSTLVPIAGLAPGRYVLEVAVESLLTAARVARSVAITVDPASK